MPVHTQAALEGGERRKLGQHGEVSKVGSATRTFAPAGCARADLLSDLLAEACHQFIDVDPRELARAWQWCGIVQGTPSVSSAARRTLTSVGRNAVPMNAVPVRFITSNTAAESSQS